MNPPEAAATALPPKDYLAPGFARIRLDACFPGMIQGDRARADWLYLT